MLVVVVFSLHYIASHMGGLLSTGARFAGLSWRRHGVGRRLWRVFGGGRMVAGRHTCLRTTLQ